MSDFFPKPAMVFIGFFKFPYSGTPCTHFYSLQAQLQSVTEHLSDEQHPASQEHSVHPEFVQLQPIVNNAVNIIKIFILNDTHFLRKVN